VFFRSGVRFATEVSAVGGGKRRRLPRRVPCSRNVRLRDRCADVAVRLAPAGRTGADSITDLILGIRCELMSGTLRCTHCDVQDGTTAQPSRKRSAFNW
jgi:hypothetical protein